MYDQLVFIFGHLQETCGPLWPDSFHPWAAIFLADYVRGLITETQFLQLFPMVNSDYIPLGQCIVDTANLQSR
jgi:hypothetical protein